MDNSSSGSAREPTPSEAPAPSPTADLLTLRQQSDTFWDQGHVEEALAVLEEGQRRAPVDPEFPAALAHRLNELGRPAEALEACRQALAQDPSHASALFAQGFASLLLERLPEAEATMDTLVTVDPAYPSGAWMRAGIVRQRRGDADPATMAAYDMALAVDPENQYLCVERADVLRALERYTEARDVYAEVHSCADCVDTELRIEATFKLGCVSLILDDIPAARSAFHSVLAVRPDYPDAREMLEMLEKE